jgi:hypothetical protein
MIRSIRKSNTIISLEYAHSADTMGAETFETEVVNGVPTLRFSLHPVDENQRDDEDNLRTHELLLVQVFDDYVRRKLFSFIRVDMMLEIFSRGQKFAYKVINYTAVDGVLRLTVKSGT